MLHSHKKCDKGEIMKSKEQITKGIEHARFALSNVQSVNRHIDAKVGGTIAILGMFLGLTMAKDKMREIVSLRANHDGLKYLGAGLVGAMLLAVVAVAIFGVLTLVARSKGDEKTPRKLWVVFPLISKQNSEKHVRIEITRRLCEEEKYDEKAIATELAEQLAICGNIMTKKIRWSKWMLWSALSCVILDMILQLSSTWGKL